MSQFVWPAVNDECDEFWKDVFETAVLPHLNAYELWIVKQTCSAMRAKVERHLTLHPALDLILRPFFPNAASAFVQVLRQTKAYVSGSAALAYFTRNVNHDRVGDLDIYVVVAAADFIATFLRKQGYHFVPYQWQSHFEEFRSDERLRPYLGEHILDVLNFNNGDETVQLIVVKSSPLAAVLDHHSTVVTVFMDGYHAACLYPELTFKLKVNVAGCGTKTRELSARKKYEDRGWRCISRHDELNGLREMYLWEIRTMGDKACWIETVGEDHGFIPASQSWSAMPSHGIHVKLHYNVFRRDRM
ncbi:hypothetical protein BDZ89DRAFT_1140807 [Hymenopellis radicata]|nr:hypothetical protein BDZ89DRAFT_1140807 [Hymenopellis radicata]